MSKKKKKFFGSQEPEEASKPGDDSADESQKDEVETVTEEVKESAAPEEVQTENEVPGKYRKFQ